MKEIRVGEYVRTRDGRIFKVKQINEGYLIEDIEYGGLGCFIEYAVKHNFNIIDLIEDEDFVILEYKSPKYRERIKRIFEVSKIDEYISFENVHCVFNCKVGDKKIIDNICKNVKIKSIVTKEMMESVEYRID